jgi:hypothetical protein
MVRVGDTSRWLQRQCAYKVIDWRLAFDVKPAHIPPVELALVHYTTARECWNCYLSIA